MVATRRISFPFSPPALFLAAATAVAADHTVTVTDNPSQRFNPKLLTVQAGDTVTWSNVAGTHNVVADDASFTSGTPAAAPWTYSHTFASIGSFSYSCTLHDSDGQVGTIVVRPARPANEIAYTVNAWDMERYGGDPGSNPTLLSLFARTVGTYQAAVRLPAGVKLTALEFSACHQPLNAGLAVASLLICPEPMQSCAIIASVPTSASSTTPCRVFVSNLADGAIIDNINNTYGLRVDTFDESFRSVKIYYRKVLSAAPATATFGDVPESDQFFRAIEALAASGITQGCGDGNFCPGDPVTRGAMAGFLSRAFGLFWAN